MKVWDNQGSESAWSSGFSFKTAVHLYPDVNFNYSPAKPSAGEVINFSDNSFCYDVGAVSYACRADAATFYEWDFNEDGIPDASTPDANYTYSSRGSHPVTLKVTDKDGSLCSGEKTISVGIPLPTWREVLPR